MGRTNGHSNLIRREMQFDFEIFVQWDGINNCLRINLCLVQGTRSQT